MFKFFNIEDNVQFYISSNFSIEPRTGLNTPPATLVITDDLEEPGRVPHGEMVENVFQLESDAPFVQVHRVDIFSGGIEGLRKLNDDIDAGRVTPDVINMSWHQNLETYAMPSVEAIVNSIYPETGDYKRREDLLNALRGNRALTETERTMVFAQFNPEFVREMQELIPKFRRVIPSSLNNPSWFNVVVLFSPYQTLEEIQKALADPNTRGVVIPSDSLDAIGNNLRYDNSNYPMTQPEQGIYNIEAEMNADGKIIRAFLVSGNRRHEIPEEDWYSYIDESILTSIQQFINKPIDTVLATYEEHITLINMFDRDNNDLSRFQDKVFEVDSLLRAVNDVIEFEQRAINAIQYSDQRAERIAALNGFIYYMEQGKDLGNYYHYTKDEQGAIHRVPFRNNNGNLIFNPANESNAQNVVGFIMGTSFSAPAASAKQIDLFSPREVFIDIPPSNAHFMTQG